MILPTQLQCKLQQARIADQAGDGTEGACICEIQVAWVSKLRMIEEVERLGAELEVGAFRDRELLEHGSIHIAESRAAGLFGLSS